MDALFGIEILTYCIYAYKYMISKVEISFELPPFI